MTNEDKIAAAIIAFLGNLLPFLVVVNVLNWSGTTIASFMLVITSALTTAGLIYQSVQHKTVVAPPVAMPPVEPPVAPGMPA